MAIRVLSWNVEHFRDGSKISAVAEHIKKHDPDVFALYEVETQQRNAIDGRQTGAFADRQMGRLSAR